MIKVWRDFFSSKWNLMLVFVLPWSLMTMFVFLFQDGVISGIKTIIVDQDNTVLSRQISRSFAENDIFSVSETRATYEEALELVQREKNDLIVYIPAGFSQAISEKQQTQVALIADGSNMAISSNALKKAGEILLTYQAGVRISFLEGEGLPPDLAYQTAVPVKTTYSTWGNVTGNFRDFMLWGLAATLCHIPIVMLAASSLAKGKKNLSVFRLCLEKNVFFASVGTVQLGLCLLGMIFFSSMYFANNYFWLLLLVAFFMLAAASLGVFLSALLPDVVEATVVAMVAVLPAYMLSGHTWPFYSFLPFIRFLAALEPLTYFADTLRDLALRPELPACYWQNLVSLGLYPLLLLPLSFFFYKFKLKGVKQHG